MACFTSSNGKNPDRSIVCNANRANRFYIKASVVEFVVMEFVSLAVEIHALRSAGGSIIRKDNGLGNCL